MSESQNPNGNIASNVVNGLFSMGNTLLNVTGGLISGKRNYKYSKKLMDRQQNYWEKQFNMQNEYNTPEAQLNRLYDAGINPLYNSDFSGNSAAGISVPNMSPAGAGQPDLGSALSSGLETFMKLKQLELNEKAVSSQANLNNANADKASMETRIMEAKSPHEISLLLSQIKNTDQKTEESKKNVDMMSAQIVNMSKDIAIKTQQLLVNMYDAETKRLTSEWEKSVAFQNAATNRTNAAANMMNAKTNQQQVKATYDMEFKKLKQRSNELAFEIKKYGFEKSQKIIDNVTNSVFGVKYTSPDDIKSMLVVQTALSDCLEQNVISPDDKIKCMETLNSLNNNLRLFYPNDAFLTKLFAGKSIFQK